MEVEYHLRIFVLVFPVILPVNLLCFFLFMRLNPSYCVASTQRNPKRDSWPFLLMLCMCLGFGQYLSDVADTLIYHICFGAYLFFQCLFSSYLPCFSFCFLLFFVVVVCTLLSRMAGPYFNQLLKMLDPDDQDSDAKNAAFCSKICGIVLEFFSLFFLFLIQLSKNINLLMRKIF